MAPRVSGKGVRRKCYFCGCCLMQSPDAEQVEQGRASCEDGSLGEPVGEEA